jgi:3'-5' exonuclease
MSPCKIVIDIETVPSQLDWVPDYLKSKLKPPATIKKPESIEEWWKDKADDAMQIDYERASLDGAMNHIICIGVAINDMPVTHFYAKDPANDERNMLIAFYNFITENCGDYAHTWIGHNILGFDLKNIRQRSMVHGIVPPIFMNRVFNDKWGDACFDTMLRWSNDRREFIGLEKLCLALGVQTPKNGLTGAEVYGAWKDGRHDEIAEYCRGDVEATRAVYRRMVGVI